VNKVAHETFADFRALAAREVRARAEEAEQRPRGDAPPSREEAAWRWLYREMRGARAEVVADLDAKVVEKYAAWLGYGYFRNRYGRRDVFMPF
jgi:hypothetical protein